MSYIQEEVDIDLIINKLIDKHCNFPSNIRAKQKNIITRNQMCMYKKQGNIFGAAYATRTLSTCQSLWYFIYYQGDIHGQYPDLLRIF